VLTCPGTRWVRFVIQTEPIFWCLLAAQIHRSPPNFYSSIITGLVMTYVCQFGRSGMYGSKWLGRLRFLPMFWSLYIVICPICFNFVILSLLFLKQRQSLLIFFLKELTVWVQLNKTVFSREFAHRFWVFYDYFNLYFDINYLNSILKKYNKILEYF